MTGQNNTFPETETRTAKRMKERHQPASVVKNKAMLVMPVMCLQEKEGLRIASYRAINPQKKGTVFYNYCSSFVLGFERSSFVGVVMRLTSK